MRAFPLFCGFAVFCILVVSVLVIGRALDQQGNQQAGYCDPSSALADSSICK